MTNPIKSFFLFCSGANGSILGMAGCEVEHGKYAGIGATIFFTAALATLSGAYAMFTVFHNAWLAFAFGLFWGLIIFNLDRFIVSSIRKPQLRANLHFTQWLTAKGNEFLKALPRLILAVFISVIITKPLELKLFEVEIDGQMTKDLISERTRLDDEIKAEYADIPGLEKEAEKLRTRLSELETERNNRIKTAAGEAGGFAGSKRAGYGPLYLQRQAEVRQAEAELKTFRETYEPLIKAKEKEINQRKAERDGKIAQAKSNIDNSRGLLKRLEALSTLTNRWSVFWASIFLVFLFISLETAPILVKLFSSRGPYDDHLESTEHQVYATQQKEISDTNDKVNTSVALSKQFNAERLKTEAPLTMSELQALAPQEFKDAQDEIARRAIELWKMRQLNYLNRGARSAPSSAPSVTQAPSPPNMSASPPNAPPSSSPRAAAAAAGASSGTPLTASPSNNNGGVNASAGASPQTAASQSASLVGVQAAAIAAPQSPAATTQQGSSSTAQQVLSAAGQQTNPGAPQTAQSSNSNVSTP